MESVGLAELAAAAGERALGRSTTAGVHRSRVRERAGAAGAGRAHRRRRRRVPAPVPRLARPPGATSTVPACCWCPHELSAVAQDLDRVVVLKRTVLFDGPPSRADGGGRQPGRPPRGPAAVAGGAALMPWPLSRCRIRSSSTFMQRALVAGVVVGVFAPMIGTFLVQKRMSLIGDGIGHVAFAGCRRGADRRRLAGVDGARVRGGRRARRRVAAVAPAGLGRPGARALLLFGDRAGRGAGEPGRRAQREPADLPVRPTADGERQRARRDPDPGCGHRRVDARAAPRAVRGRDGRGLVARRRSAGRVREQRARGADGRGRRRRDADRGHPADRRDDGAARRERAGARPLVRLHAPMVDRGQRGVGGRRAGRVADLGNSRPAAPSCSSRPACSPWSSVVRRGVAPRLPATEKAEL